MKNEYTGLHSTVLFPFLYSRSAEITFHNRRHRIFEVVALRCRPFPVVSAINLPGDSTDKQRPFIHQSNHNHVLIQTRNPLAQRASPIRMTDSSGNGREAKNPYPAAGQKKRRQYRTTYLRKRENHRRTLSPSRRWLRTSAAEQVSTRLFSGIRRTNDRQTIRRPIMHRQKVRIGNGCRSTVYFPRP